MRMQLLEKLIKHGTLNVHYPGGETQTMGHGEPRAHIHLRDAGVLKRMLINPELNVGESYMDGDWWPGEGGLLALFQLYFANGADFGTAGPLGLFWRALEPVLKANNKLRARKNVHSHYDIDSDLFHHFLDTDLQYSCAYFETPELTLEQAQRAK